MQYLLLVRSSLRTSQNLTVQVYPNLPQSTLRVHPLIQLQISAEM